MLGLIVTPPVCPIPKLHPLATHPQAIWKQFDVYPAQIIPSMKGIMVILITVSSIFNSVAQPREYDSAAKVPEVFLIGQYQSTYNELSASSASLVSVCNDDVREAYRHLRQMAVEIQKSAFSEGFDLNGVKCWIHFFWNPDGSIRHIAFYLKPASKNISQEALTEFFTRFAKNYHLPVQSTSTFQLYTSLSFPVLKPEKQATHRPTSTQY